jgi:hypothetical protein
VARLVGLQVLFEANGERLRFIRLLTLLTDLARAGPGPALSPQDYTPHRVVLLRTHDKVSFSSSSTTTTTTTTTSLSPLSGGRCCGLCQHYTDSK